MKQEKNDIKLNIRKSRIYFTQDQSKKFNKKREKKSQKGIY